MLLLDCFQLKTLCFAGIVLELRTSPKTFDLAQQREVCGKAKGRRQPPVQSLLYISFAAGSFRKQGRGGGEGMYGEGNKAAPSPWPKVSDKTKVRQDPLLFFFVKRETGIFIFRESCVTNLHFTRRVTTRTIPLYKNILNKRIIDLASSLLTQLLLPADLMLLRQIKYFGGGGEGLGCWGK